MKVNHVKHSSKTAEHYTPASIVTYSRKLLGRIDLDPASSALANDIVSAERFYTPTEDGLAMPWSGRVFLNPPGGKARNRSGQRLWWKKLAKEWKAGHVESAVFVGFSLEILQTSQFDAAPGELLPMDFPFLIPMRRIRFLQERRGALVEGRSPTHANAIVYLPPRVDLLAVKRFRDSFGSLGRVVSVTRSPATTRPTYDLARVPAAFREALCFEPINLNLPKP